MPTTTAVTAQATDMSAGMTFGELQAFVEQAKAAGAGRNDQLKVFVTMRGRPKRLSVEITR